MKKAIGVIAVIVIVVVVEYFIISNRSENDSNREGNENIVESTENGINDNNSPGEEDVEVMQIRVSDGENNIIFELNGSGAADALYNQLPLTIEVENFSSNEKIFYPENELSIDDTPRASGGGVGILAYYEPWGDVVMFYDSFSSASGLYELGSAIEGSDQIGNLSGQITIEKLEN